MNVDTAPFSLEKLDALLDACGAEALLATSAHNTRYLLGGYRFFLYDHNDGIGASRYLPVVGYAARRPDQSFFVAAPIEDRGAHVQRPWVAEIANVAWGTVQAADAAAQRLALRGLAASNIAVEPAHLSADAMDVLARALPRATFVDATELLDELRMVKSEAELELIRSGSAAVVDSMLATFDGLSTGTTTAEAAELLRREETSRGLTYAFALAATGPEWTRTPCAQPVVHGAALSLDSGAHLNGYVADVARMAIAGEASPRHLDLLAQVAAVQEAACQAVVPGRLGREVREAGLACMATLADATNMRFQVHGTGLLTHEGPRLMADGIPPYPARHSERPLEAGMVLSIETHVTDPRVGFVKLEDTVFVTATGHEAVANRGRGWNALGGVEQEVSVGQ